MERLSDSEKSKEFMSTTMSLIQAFKKWKQYSAPKPCANPTMVVRWSIYDILRTNNCSCRNFNLPGLLAPAVVMSLPSLPYWCQTRMAFRCHRSQLSFWSDRIVWQRYRPSAITILSFSSRTWRPADFFVASLNVAPSGFTTEQNVTVIILRAY